MTAAHKIQVDEWDVLINAVCERLAQLTGNIFSEKQRPMVENRLMRRMGELKITTPSEYKAYWKKNTDTEDKVLIGLLTTHFTSFFREFTQFEWLAAELPKIVAQAKKEGRSKIKIWSSACSKGQEVWSLCMWLHHHLPKIDPRMEWSLYGSDIDADSVKEAENAVYHRRELETVPRHLWDGHWVRGKGDIADWYKVKSDLKKHATFGTQNLLDLKLAQTERFDVIFCRNVLIYFDRGNQEKVAKGLMRYLTSAGTLITGVSESLNGYGLNLRGVAPSIYKVGSSAETPTETSTQTPTPVAVPQMLNVFCIDDSPTVITILKRVLKAPNFNIIGTAANGAEAIEKLKTLKPDVITLDLHMPVMDGPTFLKTSGIAKSIPVIIMSSVNRDDHAFVSPLFELGVCDFVEKPTMDNMEKSAEELCQKLVMGVNAKKNNVQYKNETQKKAVVRTGGHVVINCGASDRKNVASMLKSNSWDKDEVSFFFNGNDLAFEQFKKDMSSHVPKAKKVSWRKTSETFPFTSLGVVWVQFHAGSEQVITNHKRKSHFLIIEESCQGQFLKSNATDISPVTSFSYLVDKFLSGN